MNGFENGTLRSGSHRVRLVAFRRDSRPNRDTFGGFSAVFVSLGGREARAGTARAQLKIAVGKVWNYKKKKKVSPPLAQFSALRAGRGSAAPKTRHITHHKYIVR